MSRLTDLTGDECEAIIACAREIRQYGAEWGVNYRTDLNRVTAEHRLFLQADRLDRITPISLVNILTGWTIGQPAAKTFVDNLANTHPLAFGQNQRKQTLHA